MNVRSLFFAAAGALTLSFASAQVDYVGQITIPDGHDVVIRQAVNPSSDGNNILYLVTPKQIYFSTPPATGNALSFAPTVISFENDVSLFSSSIAIVPAEKSSPGGNVVTISGTRNSIYSYNITTRVRQQTEIVTTPAGDRDAMAVQQATSRVLLAKDNQIFAGVRRNLPRELPLLIDGTGTGNTHFVKLTEMAFAGSEFGGLLFTLDWGAQPGEQQVKAFDIDDPNGNYFRYAFDLPDGLELTNPDGHGLTINNYGHLFIADGRGGGVEFSLTGDVLATFSPPTDELYGAANGLNGYDPALDATFITYTSDGNLFVMDGAYGLHWYRDAAATAVPEPVSYAGLAGAIVLGLAAWRRRK